MPDQHVSTSRFVPALGFHWLTPFYDAVVRTMTRERVFKQALMRQARIAPGQRVLDLAAGTGTLAIWIKQRERQAEVVGVDGDEAVLASARRKTRDAGRSIRFDRAMSHDLPYGSETFDRVVSSLFLHHLTWIDKQRTAREVFRVMKPGAELHVADWGRATNPLMRSLFLAVQCFDGFATTRDNVAGRLIALFEQAGFAEVRQRQTFSTICGTMALYSAIRPG